MIDLHCHILPDVDDGAKSMDESIEMINIALEEGIKTIVATPHYIEGIKNSSYLENQKVLESLKEETYKKNLDIEILLGNEVYSTNYIERLIENKEATSLNQSKYVLIEFPMLDIPNYAETMIYNLILKGYIPVIAHPERNARIIEDPNILYELIKKGALAQLNLGSIDGKHGEEIRKTGEILITHNMIHFLGTDAHSPRRRSPRIKKALEKISQMVDKEYFEDLCHKNTVKILEDSDIIMRQAMRYEKQIGLVGFIKRIMHIK